MGGYIVFVAAKHWVVSLIIGAVDDCPWEIYFLLKPTPLLVVVVIIIYLDPSQIDFKIVLQDVKVVLHQIEVVAGKLHWALASRRVPRTDKPNM